MGGARVSVSYRRWRRMPNTVRVPDSSFDWGMLRIGRSCLAAAGIECRSCVEVCAVRALRVSSRGHASTRLDFDTTVCTRCGDCVRVCPVDTMELNVEAA